MPKVEPILEELRRSGRFRLTDTPSDFNLTPEQVNVILWGGAGLLVLILGIALYQVWLIWRPTASLSMSPGDLPQSKATWQDWTDQAETLTQQGDYRGASRAWYLSLVFWLDQQKLVNYQPTRTNREYLVDLGDQPQFYQPLRQLISIYEQLWYGKQPGDAKDVDRCKQAVLQARQRSGGIQ